MRILLLGATGMLGTSLVHILKKKHVEVIEIGHDTLDIESHESVIRVFENHSADAVINCVAVVGINPCEQDPVRCTHINALGALYVSREAARRDMTLCQISTHAVFDGFKQGYYTENDPVCPTGVYAATKYDSEVYAAMCPRHYVVRVPTMFGPRRNTALGFVDKMLEFMVKGQELRVADDKIDSLTFSLDAAECIFSLIMDRMPYGLYHSANQGHASYYEFIVALRDMIGADVTIHRAKDKDFPGLAHKPLLTAMSSVKLPAMRGWKDALNAYVKAYNLGVERPLDLNL